MTKNSSGNTLVVTNQRVSSVEVGIPEAFSERVDALAELTKKLNALPDSAFAEIWINHEGFPSLCALLSGERGVMTVFRYEGDAGFSSRNPGAVPGPEIDFMLSNGQLDRYPAEWTYPRAQVLETVLHFARTRRVPEELSWFNESKDGAISPSDR